MELYHNFGNDGFGYFGGYFHCGESQVEKKFNCQKKGQLLIDFPEQTQDHKKHFKHQHKTKWIYYNLTIIA